MSNTINVIVIDYTGQWYEKQIDGDLESLQKLVGGWIEHVSLPESEDGMYLNEEGKILGLLHNNIATALVRSFLMDGDYIAGPAVIVGHDADGETIDADIGHWRALLRSVPEAMEVKV